MNQNLSVLSCIEVLWGSPRLDPTGDCRLGRDTRLGLGRGHVSNQTAARPPKPVSHVPYRQGGAVLIATSFTSVDRPTVLLFPV